MSAKKQNIKSKNNIIKNKNLINKNSIIIFVSGLVVGIIFMSFFIPERITKIKDGSEIIASINNENITADNLYSSLKNSYGLESLKNKIDEIILTNEYEMTDNMKSEIEETITSYMEYYGYEDETLFAYSIGFKNYDDMFDYLKLDYLRGKYYNDYVQSLISDDDIKKYYDKNVFGEIYTKYITIKDNDKDIASKILTKLESGNSFEYIVKEYEKYIEYEDLGYQGYESELNEEYFNELNNLENDSYTKNVVKINGEDTIIFRGEQKEKNSLKNETNNIKNILIKQMEENDANLFEKSLINLREKNNFKIFDTEIKESYSNYCNEYK